MEPIAEPGGPEEPAAGVMGESDGGVGPSVVEGWPPAPGPNERTGEGSGRARAAAGKGGDEDLARQRATYLSLIGLFLSVFGVFAVFGRRNRRDAVRGPFDLVLLGLGTYRAARLVAFDQVTEPLRAPVAESSGEGTRAKGRGVRRAIGEMVSCPTCIGTWIGAGLTYGLLVAPRPTRLLLAILAVSGLAESLNYAVNTLDAATKQARKRTELIERGV